MDVPVGRSPLGDAHDGQETFLFEADADDAAAALRNADAVVDV